MERENEQKYNDYHAQVLPELVRNTIENIEQRVSQIINIVNQNKHVSSLSDKFSIPSNLLVTIKQKIKPRIPDWSRVDVLSCSELPDLREYKIKARNRIHKRKLLFYGNYIFGPIIYDYLYKFIFDNFSSLTRQMAVFIDIIITISGSQIVSNPLIPHSLYQMDTKFRESSMFLLRCFNLNLEGQTAKDASKNFCKNLIHISIKTQSSSYMKRKLEKFHDSFLTHTNKLFAENRILYDCRKKTSNDVKAMMLNEHENKSQSISPKPIHKKINKNNNTTSWVRVTKYNTISKEEEKRTKKNKENKEKRKKEDNAASGINKPMVDQQVVKTIRNNRYIFLPIGIIFIFLLMIAHFVNISQPLDAMNVESNEETCLNLLTQYKLSHIWPRLIEERFDEVSLLKDITDDMLDKMQIADSDKIRFYRLQKHLEYSQYSFLQRIIHNFEFFAKFCDKNSEWLFKVLTFTGVSALLSAVFTGASGHFMYYYKKMFSDDN